MGKFDLNKVDFDRLKFWEDNKKECKVCKIIAIVTGIALLLAAAYFIYKFFTPDYLDDDVDDFYFDDDFDEEVEIEE